MADRARRVRRHISDDVSDISDDSSQGSVEEKYDPRRADAMRRGGAKEVKPVSPEARPKQGASVTSKTAVGAPSLKLKITTQPSKLREVVRASEADSLRDTLGGGQVIDGPRRRRGAPPPRTSVRAAIDRPKYQEFGESDLEDDDEQEDDEELNEFAKIGAEPEGGTDEEEDDVEMPDAPVVPKPVKVTLKPPTKSSKLSNPTVKITPADVGPVKSVEEQEMQDDPGDDEVEDSSDLSGDDDDDDDEDEEPTALNEEDADGEEEEVEEGAVGAEGGLEDDEDLDDDSDDSGSTPASGAGTPDPGKQTKRQRGRDSDGLMALDMAPQQRKFFTDAEKAMKKDEHARKRKELTKRKIQEEKSAALNRLLKPQAGKSRGAAPKPETLANLERANGHSPLEEEEEVEKANPLYTHWISDGKGVRLGVSEEWQGKYVGQVLYAEPYSGPKLPPPNGRLVQELD